MKLITEIKIEQLDKPINHDDLLMTVGSCFSDNISKYLIDRKFNILANPFGVLFNPLSIYNSMKLALIKKEINSNDLIYHMDEWHSFYFHSDFSSDDRDKCLNVLNSSIKETNRWLKKARWIFITYGTSYVYEHRNSNIVVSNCHKIPGKEFDKKLLSTDQVEKIINNTIDEIKKINPEIKFIFTVSPVRHWSDGAVDNQVSKATLIVSLNNILKRREDNNLNYFPSYEILLDELRDYRFYKKDMLHPNEIAIEYIWEKFQKYAMSADCQKTIINMEKLLSAIQHKPRNASSSGYQKFIKENLKLIEKYKKDYSHIDFSKEIKFFEEKTKS